MIEFLAFLVVGIPVAFVLLLVLFTALFILAFAATAIMAVGIGIMNFFQSS